MKRNLIALLAFLILSCSSAFAADKPQTDAQRQQWFKNMVATKVEFLTKQLALNENQKARFAKEYTAMSSETSKLASETRKLERSVSKNTNATDLEYEKAAEAMTEFKSKEAAIELRYFNQFKTYLSKKQLFQLKIAENKWMRELMKQRGKGKK